MLFVLFEWAFIFKNFIFDFLHFYFFDISGVGNQFFSSTTSWIWKGLCQPVDYGWHWIITEGFFSKRLCPGDIVQGISRTYQYWLTFDFKNHKNLKQDISKKSFCNNPITPIVYLTAKNCAILTSTNAIKRFLNEHILLLFTLVSIATMHTVVWVEALFNWDVHRVFLVEVSYEFSRKHEI